MSARIDIELRYITGQTIYTGLIVSYNTPLYAVKKSIDKISKHAHSMKASIGNRVIYTRG